jgi:small subunit ribosomal protein S6
VLHHNEYETIVILRPDLDDSVTTGLIEKLEQIITGQGGHILLRDDWGKRKLAYPIAKHQKGHYTLIAHLAPPELVTELERRIRNEDSIIRFLTSKVDDAVDVPVRMEQMAEQRRIREEQDRLRRERGELGQDNDLEDDEEIGEESDD